MLLRFFVRVVMLAGTSLSTRDCNRAMSDQMHRPANAAPTAGIAPLLWPARLHHVALGTPDVAALAQFYADHLGRSSGPIIWILR